MLSLLHILLWILAGAAALLAAVALFVIGLLVVLLLDKPGVK